MYNPMRRREKGPRVSRFQTVNRWQSWRLRRKGARHAKRLDAGKIVTLHFVESGFLDAHDPDGMGTHLADGGDVLYHLGRLHLRVTKDYFERLAAFLREQEAHGQRFGVVEKIAEAEYPPRVKILQVLDGGPERAYGRFDEPM